MEDPPVSSSHLKSDQEIPSVGKGLQNVSDKSQQVLVEERQTQSPPIGRKSSAVTKDTASSNVILGPSEVTEDIPSTTETQANFNGDRINTTSAPLRGNEAGVSTNKSPRVTNAEGEERLSDQDERDQAFREIVENAKVEVVPPATGYTAHPEAFGDYFMAKLNKTKIIDFPSWDSANQSPEFNLYIAKSELLKVTQELTQTRRTDAKNRSYLAEQTSQLEKKQANFSELIVNTEPFIQQNKEIRSRFARIIDRNEAKELLLREKTVLLREDAKKYVRWEKLMRAMVETYQPFQDVVTSCLNQSPDEYNDLESLMNTYVAKLYAKYEHMDQLYADIHRIGATKHDLSKATGKHGEAMKNLADQVSELRSQLRELTAQKVLLEKQRTLLTQEKQSASQEWTEVQKSLDIAYKLFILDAPDHQNTSNTKEKTAKKSKPKTVEDKVCELGLQHDYLSEVLRLATQLYESSDDTVRGHVSMDTIRFSM